MTTSVARESPAADISRHGLITVLYVEDNPADARLVQLQLEESGGFSLDHVETLGEARARLAGRAYDVILLDLSLPDAHGRETFDAVTALAPRLPVVVLTGLDDEPTALSLVQAGAQDYLVKGPFEGPLVGRSLRYAVQRHRLQQALDAARRRESEQKDRFLSHVSHELRSPLAVSFLYTTNVLDGVVGELTPEQRDHLSVAVDGLRAQMRLIDELLATVRADPAHISIERTAVDLRALITDTIRAFGVRQDGVTIVDRTAAALPTVHADPRRIQQVLTNLIDNALKFSPRGGVVRVTASLPTNDPGFVRLDVSDQGPGIPDAAREQIFNCLFLDENASEGQKGLGLGLYLSKLLVARHGGRIWVESAEGGGSRFIFTLPFLPPAAGPDRVC